MTSNKTATLMYEWVFLITVITAVTANAQMWWHLHLLRNSLHEWEGPSYLSCNILYSGLNFSEFSVEWIVLVVFNPAREFHFQTLHQVICIFCENCPSWTISHTPYLYIKLKYFLPDLHSPYIHIWYCAAVKAVHL